MKFAGEPKVDCHLHVFDPERFPYLMWETSRAWFGFA